MVDKSLCVDFADAILAHYQYKLGFDTFITAARNVITCLVFDKTISESEIPIAAKYMLEEVASGFGLQSSQISDMSANFPRLAVEFDNSTTGKIIQAVNVRRYMIGPDGQLDPTKLTADNVMRNGYELIAMQLMQKGKK